MTDPTESQSAVMFELDKELTALLGRTLRKMDADYDIDDPTALAILMSVLGRLTAQLALAYDIPEHQYLLGMQTSYQAVKAGIAMQSALKAAQSGSATN